MSSILKESLMKKQLPAFINDTLGNVSFGPILKTQSNDVVVIGNAEYHIDDLMKRCNENKEIKNLIFQLVDGIGKASPHKLFRQQNAGFVAKVWNSLTGASDTKKIEFKLYCRKVEAIAEKAPVILLQAESTIPVLDKLHTLYKRDIELLERYIETGEQFIESFNSNETLPKQTVFGLDRLRRKIVNMKVTLTSLEMHCTSVNLLIEASLYHVDRVKECINDVLPMWRTQVRMFNSGVYDVDIDVETQKRFEALVNRMNSMKGNI